MLPLFLPNFVVSNCFSSYYLVSSLQLPYRLRRDDAQPNLAALLLNTVCIQPGSQPHQCVGGNTVHLATLVSNQALPNPDDAGPIVHRPMNLPVAAGYDRAWARTQSL
jgi:hypothetical protein